MKITYYVPTTDQEQAELCATIARLFPGSDPHVTQRATGTSNIDWQHLDSLADLLDAKPTYSPFVVFSTDPAPDTYQPEQITILKRPGVETRRDIDPQELLDEIHKEMEE
jgi:hypothetical protein